MAHALSLAMRLFIVVFAMGYRIVEGTINSTTAFDQESSSLGYPCNLDELQIHGFAPEWNNGCKGPHQLLFLHIPKTGGESIEAALGMKKDHDIARVRRQSMGKKAWDCAFKFSIARNPWARWESWHSFCRSGYGKTLKLPLPQWACTMARSMTLSSWTKNMIVLLSGLETLHPDIENQLMNHEGEFEQAWWLASQSEYVTDGVNLDKLLPNYIISFENLESDFACLTALLGLSAELEHKNPSVVVEGMSTAERVANFDQEARELIGDYNIFEIEMYGYEFPG